MRIEPAIRAPTSPVSGSALIGLIVAKPPLPQIEKSQGTSRSTSCANLPSATVFCSPSRFIGYSPIAQLQHAADLSQCRQVALVEADFTDRNSHLHLPPAARSGEIARALAPRRFSTADQNAEVRALTATPSWHAGGQSLGGLGSRSKDYSGDDREIEGSPVAKEAAEKKTL